MVQRFVQAVPLAHVCLMKVKQTSARLPSVFASPLLSSMSTE